MITYLDGRRLQRALAAGLRQVREGRAVLDDMNVFPVADHDTGTNLVLTLGALDTAAPRHAGECLRTMATRALDHAQGWAGAVLAWFLHGAALALPGAARLSSSELAIVMRAGVESGRRGVVQAQAGTIVDVLEEAAAAVQRAADRGERDLGRILRETLDAARAALDGTPDRCPALRAAGVVDAGGQAVVMMLEGMQRLLAPAARGFVRVVADEQRPVPDAGPVSRRSGGAVVVVTDTGADLPQADVDALGIGMVPLRLNIDGRVFLDKTELPAREFQALLRTSAAATKTSQPSPGDFLRAHAPAADGTCAVVSIHLPEVLSGTLNGARVSARHVAPMAVHVVDAGNVSVGQGLVVRYAAEAARAGLSAVDVVAAVRAIVPCTRTVAVVRDLSFAVRGGRVGCGTQRLADALRLAPVLGNRGDGRVRPVGVLFGRHDLARRLAQRVLRSLDRARTWRIAIAHCDDENGAARLLDLLVAGITHLDHACVVDCGSALGAHAGPGALVVGIQDYRPPRAGREGVI